MSTEGIARLFNTLLAGRNKDKKELCLTLAVINRNIEDWFNEDNKLYSYKDSYSVSELRKALGTKCRIPATERAITFLDYIEEQFNHNNLNKDVIEKLYPYPDKVGRVREHLRDFKWTIETAKDNKHRSISSLPEKSNVKLDYYLINSIELLRREINNLITNLLLDLKCADVNITETYKEYTR